MTTKNIDFGNATQSDILNLLADAESELFHLHADNPDNEELTKAHASAKQALEAFARAVGIIH